MEVRKIKISNSKGVEYDLTPEAGAEGVYFLGTSGYGYETDETTQLVGNTYQILEFNYKQHTISGSLVFYGDDPYALYYDFTRFLSSRPLTLSLEFVDGKIYNLDVYVSKLSKSERSYVNGLVTSVDFSAYGLFYTEPGVISSETSEKTEDTSRIYKYPPGTVYFCDPTNMPLSFTDPCKYLESIINGYAQILYLEDDGVYLVTKDSRPDVTVNEEGYILIEMDGSDTRYTESEAYTTESNTDDMKTAVVSVANSYYSVRGTSASPTFKYSQNGTPVDDDYDSSAKYIDCSSYISLVLAGIAYDDSPYTGNDLKVAASWGLPLYTLGLRTAAEIGEFFATHGCTVEIGEIGASDRFSSVEVGDLVFFAKEGDNGRYMNISHVTFVRSIRTDGNHATLEVSTSSPYVLNRVLETEYSGQKPSQVVLVCRPKYVDGMVTVTDREFSIDSEGYVLAEVSTDDTDSLLVECYPGTDAKIYESDTESPYVKSEVYMSNYHVLNGDVLTEETGELYEIYQGEYSVLSNSTYISFTSDSEVESPCKLSIGSTSGDVVNPHWYHYLNGVLNGEGKYNGTIPQGNTLVIDTSVIPYSIKQFDSDGTEVVDCYESCDFSMERFIFIGCGVNTFSVTHENSTELNITMAPRVEYETV